MSVRSIDEGGLPRDGLFKGDGSSCDEHDRANAGPGSAGERGRKLEHAALLVKGTLSLLWAHRK